MFASEHLVILCAGCRGKRSYGWFKFTYLVEVKTLYVSYPSWKIPGMAASIVPRRLSIRQPSGWVGGLEKLIFGKGPTCHPGQWVLLEDFNQIIHHLSLFFFFLLLHMNNDPVTQGFLTDAV